MGIIHLNPAPKRFTMPYSIFFANIRYTHLSRQVVLYCLPLLLGAIYTVFMWQKCIYSIHLIVSHPLNHCCLIYPAPPCRLAHTDLPTEIFSYNLDFFFCSYLFLPGHDNTPPMMTVFYFTVSHRGSISELSAKTAGQLTKSTLSCRWFWVSVPAARRFWSARRRTRWFYNQMRRWAVDR